jgi:hypothetical protein
MLGSHLLSFAAESYSFDPLPPQDGTSYDDEYFSQLWRGGGDETTTRGRSGPSGRMTPVAAAGLRAVEELRRQPPGTVDEAAAALRRLLMDQPAGAGREELMAALEDMFDGGRMVVGGNADGGGDDAPGAFPLDDPADRLGEEDVHDGEDVENSGEVVEAEEEAEEGEREEAGHVGEGEGQAQAQAQGGFLAGLLGMFRGWTGTGTSGGDEGNGGQEGRSA